MEIKGSEKKKNQGELGVLYSLTHVCVSRAARYGRDTWINSAI